MKALTPIEYWHMIHASNGNCALSDEILESGQWDVCVQDALVLRGLVANIYCEDRYIFKRPLEEQDETGDIES